MNVVLIGVVIVVAGLVVWLLLQTSQEQKRNALLEVQLNELRRDLQAMGSAQAQTVGQMQAISQGVTQRLDGVAKALQDGVSSSAQIATQGQTAIANELKTARDQIGHLQKQMGEFQELGRGISSATKSLESVLGGAKTRGLLGEMTLERLLQDSLPPSQYATQYRFSTGEAADAVIFLRDKKLVAIDSKFPLEAFRKIETEGDEARRAFAASVKLHADSIAKKYIVPDQGTLDLALMFVPSETVYYEMLVTQDSKGEQLDAYCRSKSIIAVSPNTLYAHLCVIHLGLRGMQIEENAKRISGGLSGIQKQLGVFTDVFEKLGTHLKNAQQNYAEADKRLEKTHDALGSLIGGGSPDAAVENERATLPLPEQAAAKASR